MADMQVGDKVILKWSNGHISPAEIIRIELTDHPYIIRIAEGGHWAHKGTDTLRVKPEQIELVS